MLGMEAILKWLRRSEGQDLTAVRQAAPVRLTIPRSGPSFNRAGNGSLLLCLTGLLFLARTAAGRDYTLTNLWSAWIGAHSDSSPALSDDGTLFVGTAKGELFAIETNGVIKWAFQTGREIRSSPAVALDGTVYAGSRDHYFYAVSPNGRLKWKFKTGAWVDSSPALARDGTVYFGSWDKTFYALNADGTERWRYPTQGEIVSSPAIGADGTIYFGGHDQKFYALDRDGRKKWEYPTAGPIISSPGIGQDHALYFTSVDGNLYVLNPDGSLRWRLRTGGVTASSPVLGAGDTIYLGVNVELWALTPAGKQIWPRGDGEPFYSTPLALENKLVAYMSRRGAEMILDENREVVCNYYCYGGGYSCASIGPTGTTYVIDRGYYLSALDSTFPLANSAWPRFRGNPRNTGNVVDSPLASQTARPPN